MNTGCSRRLGALLLGLVGLVVIGVLVGPERFPVGGVRHLAATRVRRLCSGVDPASSPDGTRAAFMEGDYDQRGRLTGMVIKLLTFPNKVELLGEFLGETDLLWLPDSRHIVYGERGRLYAIALVGSRRVKEIGRYGGRFPSLSPDGKWVADVRPTPSANIWVSKIDGTQARAVTDFAEGNPGVDHRARIAWSPNGRWIVFTMRSSHLVPMPVGKGKIANPTIQAAHRLSRFGGGLWMVEVHSKRLARLTKDPSDRWPSWSRDGTRLAFVRNLGEVWIVTIPSGTPMRIDEISAETISWSGRNDTLVFGSTDGSICVLDLQKSSARP